MARLLRYSRRTEIYERVLGRSGTATRTLWGRKETDERFPAGSAILPNDLCRRRRFHVTPRSAEVFTAHQWLDIPRTNFYNYIFSDLDKELEDKTSVICGVSGDTYTFKEMRDLSKQVGISMLERGYRHKDVVAILSPNSPEYILTILGCAYAGLTITVINPLYNAQEVIKQLKETNACCFFVFPKFGEIADEAKEASPRIREIVIYGIPISGGQSLAELYFKLFHGSYPSMPFSDLTDGVELRNPWFVEEPDVNPMEDDLLITYSSGTTGPPKGVQHTHYTATSLVEQICKYDATYEFYGAGFLLVLPIFHIFGFAAGCITLKMGSTIVTNPLFNHSLFLGSIKKYSLGVIPVVPPLLSFLAMEKSVGDYDLSSMRATFCGGAALHEEVAIAFEKRFPNARSTQGYAMTEGLFCTSIRRDHPKTSLGIPVPNSRFKVIDVENNAELGKNQEGELIFDTASAMKGYLNNEQATREAFLVDGDGTRWLRTGDVGYVSDTDDLYIVDRIKELLKYKGHQVSPVEVEELVTKMPGVEDAAIIGRPHRDFGDLPTAFVVKEPQSEITEEEVKQFVIDNSAYHNHLRGGVIFIEAIPRNPIGKILRRKLKKILEKDSSV